MGLVIQLDFLDRIWELSPNVIVLTYYIGLKALTETGTVRYCIPLGGLRIMMENQLSPFNFMEGKKEQQQERKFYKLYVGIDIGASFHVAACIQFQAFMDPTGREWKRVKTMKFNADSLGITTFLEALKQAEKAASVNRNEILILLEPTGGHYSFLITQLLLEEGYELF